MRIKYGNCLRFIDVMQSSYLSIPTGICIYINISLSFDMYYQLFSVSILCLLNLV